MPLATIDGFVDVMVDGDAALALRFKDGPGLEFLEM